MKKLQESSKFHPASVLVSSKACVLCHARVNHRDVEESPVGTPTAISLLVRGLHGCPHRAVLVQTNCLALA